MTIRIVTSWKLEIDKKSTYFNSMTIMIVTSWKLKIDKKSIYSNSIIPGVKPCPTVSLESGPHIQWWKSGRWSRREILEQQHWGKETIGM